jgi:hypothetical protein
VKEGKMISKRHFIGKYYWRWWGLENWSFNFKKAQHYNFWILNIGPVTIGRRI